MAEVVARSQMLSDVFSLIWNSGKMSTVMRCNMGMIHQFELGFISMVDLKYKVRTLDRSLRGRFVEEFL